MKADWKKRLFFVGLLLGGLGSLGAAASYQAPTATVRADFLRVKEADFILTKKKNSVHLLWNSFPYAGALAQESLDTGLDLSYLRKKVVARLLAFARKTRFPKAKKFTVDVVEFPQADDDAEPQWGSLKKLDTYQGTWAADGSLVWHLEK